MQRAPAALWPVAGLLVGALATLPHFANPLNTSEANEIADHVIPGLLVMAVSAAALVMLQRNPGPSFRFAAGLVVVLAGFWMVATHVALIAQANRGAVGWGGAVYHGGSGLVVLGFGVVWVAAHWSDL